MELKWYYCPVCDVTLVLSAHEVESVNRDAWHLGWDDERCYGKFVPVAEQLEFDF